MIILKAYLRKQWKYFSFFPLLFSFFVPFVIFIKSIRFIRVTIILYTIIINILTPYCTVFFCSTQFYHVQISIPISISIITPMSDFLLWYWHCYCNWYLYCTSKMKCLLWKTFDWELGVIGLNNTNNDAKNT